MEYGLVFWGEMKAWVWNNCAQLFPKFSFLLIKKWTVHYLWLHNTCMSGFRVSVDFVCFLCYVFDLLQWRQVFQFRIAEFIRLKDFLINLPFLAVFYVCLHALVWSICFFKLLKFILRQGNLGVLYYFSSLKRFELDTSWCNPI